MISLAMISLAMIMAVAAPALAKDAAAPVPAPASPGFPQPGAPGYFGPPAPEQTVAPVQLSLAATLAGGDGQPIRSGLKWRVFAVAGEGPRLVAESGEATPQFSLPPGQYVVHAAWGLAGTPKAVNLKSGPPVAERLSLNAGGLKVIGLLGDTPAAAARLGVAIFVPERGNAEAKLVLAKGKPGEVILLPEGQYHVVSTLYDSPSGGGLASPGAMVATNSVVTADLKVQTGKITEASLRHRAAVMTLKLVNAPGGEALANTQFSVLTPGGDVIRELIGAFPQLALAEGEYVAIARHQGKTYQSVFKVESNLDRDVEVLAREDKSAPREEKASPGEGASDGE